MFFDFFLDESVHFGGDNSFPPINDPFFLTFIITTPPFKESLGSSFYSSFYYGGGV